MSTNIELNKLEKNLSEKFKKEAKEKKVSLETLAYHWLDDRVIVYEEDIAEDIADETEEDIGNKIIEDLKDISILQSLYYSTVEHTFHKYLKQARKEGSYRKKQIDLKGFYEELNEKSPDELTKEIRRLKMGRDRFTYKKDDIDSEYQKVISMLDGIIKMIQAQIDIAHEVKMQRACVQSGEVDLHFTILGEGTPILLLSGGPGFSSSYLLPIAQGLSDGYKSILLDQRGTGKSKLTGESKPDDYTKISVKILINDIEILRKHLGIPEWVVLGHSWGGRLAMAYTAECRKYVKALVLVGSGGLDRDNYNYGKDLEDNIKARQNDFESEATSFWNNRLNIEIDPSRAIIEKLRTQLQAYVYEKEDSLPILSKASPNYFNPILFKDMGNNKELDKEFREKDLDLRKYSKPVLIIQGEQDPMGSSTAYGIYKIFEATPRFKVTEKSLRNLRLEGVPEKIIQKLKPMIKNGEALELEYEVFLKELEKTLRNKPPEYKSLILEHAKTHQIVFIDKSGHFPWKEQREIFFSEVTNFLERHDLKLAH